MPPILEEVYLFDFFIVEIFQTFFPEIYGDMKKAPWYYVSKWSFETLLSSPLPHDAKQKYQAIKEHIEGLTKTNSFRNLIISLLGCIYPEVEKAFSTSGYGSDHESSARDYRIKHRIAHGDCFLKYFMLGVRKGVISDSEFDTMIKLWKDAESTEDEIRKSLIMKYQKEFKLLEILKRLKIYSDFLDAKLVLPLIKTLYKNCDNFRREGDLWDTELDQAEMLIMILIENNKGIADNKINDILHEVVNNVVRFDLASKIVLYSNRVRNNSFYRIRNNVNIDSLRNSLADRLNKYFIEGERDIFDEYKQAREFGFILYQWATRWEDENKNYKEEVTDYLIKIFKKKSNKIGFYLLHFMKNRMHTYDIDSFDYSDFIKAYNADKFAQFLDTLEDKEAAYSTINEKEAIDLFLKAHAEASKNLPISS
ncbi:MAG TPA: hypothetical protein VMU29_01865 [Smithella sp.]|nr:hypothetical protein [Smithella sp.]